MPEKTVNASQKIILLRLRFIVIALCLSLLLCSFALPASAAVLDYNDYVTNVKVDGDNDIVTVSFPLDSMRISLIEIGVGEVASVVGSSLSVVVSADTRYVVRCYPLGDSISLSNIPSDTVCSLSLSIDSRSWGYIDVTNAYSSFGFAYYGKSGNFLDLIWGGLNHDNEWDMTASEVLTPVPDAFSFLPMCDFCDFSFWEGRTVDIGVYYFTMTMTISSLYRLQQQSGKTNEILTEVEKQLADQGKTLDEVLQQQQQTNDKLDDMQGSIETLPGQIGDEMQGIIDNEKEQSKGEGNKFVDQILDALPDPSTDVLAALKGLTDATAYTGTDAVLPIPAIVLPGIDGLFPETEIWGGTQFDFGESISMLPSSLLTLVQSLFTIAIVLYCVYELKGIISYCLTLRESKGG